MVSRLPHLAALGLWIAALWAGLDWAARPASAPAALPATTVDWPVFFAAQILPSLPVAEEFDTPLRPPDGQGAVVTLPFLEVGHLGEDWATAPGDASLGEPVFSVADGWVALAEDRQDAWGSVVFVDYRLPAGRYPPFIEVLYASLRKTAVVTGQFVRRGQPIGTMGNAGLYKTHLHWEVRQTVGLGVGPGFDTRRDGWLAPSEFLGAHRGERADRPLLPRLLDKGQRDGWGTDL